MIGAGFQNGSAWPQGSTGAADRGPALGCASERLAMPWRARPVGSVDSPISDLSGRGSGTANT